MLKSTNRITAYVVTCCVVIVTLGVGAYLIMHGHGTAGGFMLVFACLIAVTPSPH